MTEDDTQPSHAAPHSGPNDRDAKPTLRAAGLVLAERGLLLVRQRRLDRTYWLLPGGGVRFGETIADALRRELLEELRLEIVPGRPLALAEAISDDMVAYRKHVVHVIVEARLVDAAAEPRLGGDEAVLEARFVARDELGALTLRPPVASFLDRCFAAPPRHMEYLGVVW